MFDKNPPLKWPYIQMTKSDDEQTIINKKIKLTCVSFIDILGFKNMVYNDVNTVIFALRMIKMFCNSFFKFPKRDDEETYIPNYVPKYDVSSDDEDEFEFEKPYVTMFSDSIVITKVIDEFFDLSEFIEFISKIQYTLLINGILIRGGISMGNLYHSESYIFGDGLIKAHHIEDKIAKTPRIVIDKEMVDREERELDKKFIQRPSPEGEGLCIGGLNRRLKAMRLKGGGFKPRVRFAAHFVRAKATFRK